MNILVARQNYHDEYEDSYYDLHMFTDEVKANAWIEAQNKIERGAYQIVPIESVDPAVPELETVHYCTLSMRNFVEEFDRVEAVSYREAGSSSQKAGFKDKGMSIMFWSTEGLEAINRELKNWLRANKLEAALKKIIYQ